MRGSPLLAQHRAAATLTAPETLSDPTSEFMPFQYIAMSIASAHSYLTTHMYGVIVTHTLIPKRSHLLSALTMRNSHLRAIEKNYPQNIYATLQHSCVPRFISTVAKEPHRWLFHNNTYCMRACVHVVAFLGLKAVCRFAPVRKCGCRRASLWCVRSEIFAWTPQVCAYAQSDLSPRVLSNLVDVCLTLCLFAHDSFKWPSCA